jgi:demethylmenaquinone methyltransferase/2-methoxy-6-polyprenyl-1,4-benzoquinol methylase
MAWYDVFARFYDASLEPLYREQRIIAAKHLDSHADSRTLDVPCGTGQSFPALIGSGGRVLGVDRSAGMVRQAKHRIADAGWDRVVAQQGDGETLTGATVAAALGGPADRLHVFLGTTVFPDLDGTLQRLWDLLAPGGRAVLVDVYADKPGFQGRMVEWIAQADLSRRAWEFLDRNAVDVRRIDLPTLPQHGGQMWLATGRKAG